mmetsp:Transcript_41559/g.124225  ORF Transcript_41559/g.124225 Transcript_41559/m.124225 type:complete len:233 (+) Transcript_41559:518-1216(+)
MPSRHRLEGHAAGPGSLGRMTWHPPLRTPCTHITSPPPRESPPVPTAGPRCPNVISHPCARRAPNSNEPLSHTLRAMAAPAPGVPRVRLPAPLRRPGDLDRDPEAAHRRDGSCCCQHSGPFPTGRATTAAFPLLPPPPRRPARPRRLRCRRGPPLLSRAQCHAEAPPAPGPAQAALAPRVPPGSARPVPWTVCQRQTPRKARPPTPPRRTHPCGLCGRRGAHSAQDCWEAPS